MPESPRWLLLSRKPDGLVIESLQRTQGRAADSKRIEEDMQKMKSMLCIDDRDIDKQNSAGSFTMDVLRPQYRKPLLAGISLMLFQQITGQPSVLYYAGKIFQDAGFSSAGSATAISVVLGVFKLIMTGLAVFTVDSWGRRPLLLLGVSGIIVALISLGTIQAGMLPIAEGSAAWVNVGALLLYVGAYQASFGPISWLIVGEIFPLSIRGQALALATLTNFAANFGVSLLIPSLQQEYGQAAMYFGFATIGVIALATVQYYIPETKGRTLEEIEGMWK